MSKNSKVSEKGQVTIPKKLRDKLGLEPGAELVFSTESGKLIAEKKIADSPYDRWTGKGKLPFGNDVDEYLEIVRGDDNSS